MIKAECEKRGIWLQKEVDRSIMDYNKIKTLTTQLVKEGYIFLLFSQMMKFSLS